MKLDVSKIFNIFNSKSKLGIDIGTSSIKIVELAKKGGRFELLNYGIFELKEFSDASGQPKPSGQSILKLPDEEIVWGLKELINKAGMKSRDVVASIPSFSTFSTVIEMPYLTEQDLAKAIPIEARKHIPLPIEELVIDWSIIGIKQGQEQTTKPVSPTNSKLSPEVGTNIEIFLAAVPKSETVRYQNIMKAAGLNLRALELENSSLVRSLLGNDLSPTAIINVGGRSTSILIISKGFERVSHNYEIGGFEITKSVARSLNIGFQRAEELKRQFGLRNVEENIVNEAMLSLIDMMVFETKKTITNYEESSKEKIASVIITGGLANMPDLTEYFKSKIGRDVFRSNVFSRILYNQDLEPAILNLGNILGVAIGLSMRQV